MGRIRPRASWTLVLLLPAMGAAVKPAAAADPALDMPGMLGPYLMARESSGTSWQPDSTPMAGVMTMGGEWMTMWHGMIDLIYDDQGGPRGAAKTFSSSMLMFMARRALPERGVRTAPDAFGRSAHGTLWLSGAVPDW